MEAFLEALFAAIIEPILAAVGYLLLYLVLYVICYPVCCLLFAPFILVRSAFGPGDYHEKVASGFRGVWGAMAHMGMGPM